MCTSISRSVWIQTFGDILKNASIAVVTTGLSGPPVWRPRGLWMLFQRWEPRRKQPSPLPNCPAIGSFQEPPINMTHAEPPPMHVILPQHCQKPQQTSYRASKLSWFKTWILTAFPKYGTVGADTCLGNLIHFAPFVLPLLLFSADLQRSVSYNRTQSDRSSYHRSPLFLFGSFLRMNFSHFILVLPSPDVQCLLNRCLQPDVPCG